MHNKWHKDEIDIIKEKYKDLSDEELVILIPRHSLSSIQTKRKDLGLTRPVWNKKYDYTNLISEIGKRGYILLSKKNEFSNAGSKMKYKCNKHKNIIQETTLGRLLEGKGCKFCGHEKTANAEKITDDKAIELCKRKGFIYCDNQIVDGKTFVFFKCKKHQNAGVQKMTYQNMKRDSCKGCRYCTKISPSNSKGEHSIKIFLEKCGIKYLRQYVHLNCKDATYLPFDFYLPEYNIMIEYDGEQHYYPVTFNGVSETRAKENYAILIEHDKIKNYFCKKNKIKMIRIPFYKFEDIEVVLFDLFVKYNILEKIA